METSPQYQTDAAPIPTEKLDEKILDLLEFAILPLIKAVQTFGSEVEHTAESVAALEAQAKLTQEKIDQALDKPPPSDV